MTPVSITTLCIVVFVYNYWKLRTLPEYSRTESTPSLDTGSLITGLIIQVPSALRHLT